VKTSFASQVCGTTALFLSFALAASPSMAAQNHIVSPAKIQNDVSAASTARQQNEKQLKGFLSSKEADQRLRSAGITPEQVSNAVSQLNNADLARLAARSTQAQRDFAAGNIDNHDLLVILVGIAVLSLIIVAVH
jgi:hypothetical protein